MFREIRLEEVFGDIVGILRLWVLGECLN